VTYRLHFEVEELPKTINAQQSMHWRRKGEYVRAWHRSVWLAVGARKPKAPLERARLTLTRYSSSEPDYDGLVSSFKPVIDGLIRCGVLKDDKYSNIGRSEYRWQKAPAKQGKIQVIVEEVGD
jgi:Holliday junction resolvase RusA-like endonuclease